MTNPSGNGPGGGSPIDGIGAGGAKPVHSVESTEAVSGADSVEAVDSTEAVSAAGPTDALAEALAAGSIDPQTARAQLIDQVVRAQLPENAPAELVEDVRADVEALLVGDPTLQRLLQP